jgi:hypothetical protein
MIGIETVSQKAADREPNADGSAMLRSRVSNRPGRLPGVDGRTERARRFKDLTSGLKRDIGRAPSAAEESLIDQAAALVIHREAMTAAGALGEPMDSRELVRISGAIGRTLAALGLTQRPERITRSFGGQPAHSPTIASMAKSEMISKTVQLLELARQTKNPEVIARATRVRQLLETAERRRLVANGHGKPDQLASS